MKKKLEFYKFTETNVQIDHPNNGGGPPKLRNVKLDIEHYKNLTKMLEEIKREFLKYQSDFSELPICFSFDKVLNKGDRFKTLFIKGKDNKLKQIDSKYLFKDNDMLNELEITYLLDKEKIDLGIKKINWVIDFINNNKEKVNKSLEIQNDKNLTLGVKDEKINEILFPENETIANKTAIKDVLSETIFIKNINIPSTTLSEIDDEVYVRFNSVKEFEELRRILSTKNIQIHEEHQVIKNSNIYNLDIKTVDEINNHFPFLINVANNDRILIDEWTTSDTTKEQIKNDEIKEYLESNKMNISDLWIGVIDTHAEFQSEFKDIIDVRNDESIVTSKRDFSHGTGVTSLLSVNDLINEEKYKDGLGIFKVRHFGIIPNESIFQTSFLTKLERIVSENKDIKIWNLSIQIHTNNNSSRISELGRQLDLLQKRHQILMVISAGNNGYISQGSDSIFSITAGGIYKDKKGINQISSFSGNKKIFNLFEKPNALDYSNDLSANSNPDDLLWVMDNRDGFLDKHNEGTSYAAPLLTRKCAYLMDRYNMEINEIKSFINACYMENTYILKELKPIDVINMTDVNKKVIIGNIDAVSGEQKSLKLKLPFFKKGNEKNYRSFLPLISISYLSEVDYQAGDEYSSTEVTMSMHADVSGVKKSVIHNYKKQSDNKASEQEEGNEGFQTQYELIKYLEKYNPNKVLFDKKLVVGKNVFTNREKITEPLNLNNDNNEITIKINRSDLFDNSKSTKIGFTIFLYEVGLNAFASFEKENEKLLEKVKEKQAERIAIKLKTT